tara:strand:+ start:1240 stop:1650 length:411 start_codon:yes stop_codon:yes gene_type:complete
MQFCTIDEAWGYKKNVKENFRQSVNESHSVSSDVSESSIKEKFTSKKKPKKVYFNHTEDSLYDGFTDTINDKHERQMLLNRVMKSRRCRDALREKFRPKLVEKFTVMLEDYRDLIVLILIGFCIVIFLNMLYNISK